MFWDKTRENQGKNRGKPPGQSIRPHFGDIGRCQVWSQLRTAVVVAVSRHHLQQTQHAIRQVTSLKKKTEKNKDLRVFEKSEIFWEI